MNNSTILIAAGGTGGHVYPAIALAQSIQKTHSNVNILFCGTAKGFESTIVPKHGFKLEFFELQGLNSKGWLYKIQSLMLIPKSLLLAYRLIRKIKPMFVLGIGGYVSGPLLFMARLCGVRTAVVEPNAVGGWTNRVLSKWTSHVFLAFEKAAVYFPKSKCIYSGNPIRESILNIPPPTFDSLTKTIFVFGGSQGAQKINRGVLEMIRLNPDFWKHFKWIHQTGVATHREVLDGYQALGIPAVVQPFFEDISKPYALCDFIIARAGSSILEIASIGRPCLLIPYPFAADAHQMDNAKLLEQQRACLVMEDAFVDGVSLGKVLEPLLASSKELKKMSDAILKFRQSNASSIIMQTIFKS